MSDSGKHGLLGGDDHRSEDDHSSSGSSLSIPDEPTVTDPMWRCHVSSGSRTAATFNRRELASRRESEAKGGEREVVPKASLTALRQPQRERVLLSAASPPPGIAIGEGELTTGTTRRHRGGRHGLKHRSAKHDSQGESTKIETLKKQPTAKCDENEALRRRLDEEWPNQSDAEAVSRFEAELQQLTERYEKRAEILAETGFHISIFSVRTLPRFTMCGPRTVMDYASASANMKHRRRIAETANLRAAKSSEGRSVNLTQVVPSGAVRTEMRDRAACV